MSRFEAGPQAATTSPAVQVGLGILAILQGIVGIWASLVPRSFYRSFPIPGHNWVSLLPPYNEHLIRDVGELNLALTVVLAAAALTGQRLLSVVAVIAAAVYAVPHAVFHMFHLRGFPTVDAVTQTTGIAVQLVVIVIVGWLLWRERGRTS
jgi:hypothetical protein